MPRRAFFGILLLIVAVILGGVTTVAQLSGRFGLDLVARRIPTTSTDEINLNTPSEFVMLEFAIASNLILNVDLGFADLNIDAVVNTAGPEHLVFKAPINIGELPFYEITFDKLSIAPEVWFAVPFEAVTDVNNLPNSVIVPPGDIMFAKARVTLSTSISGFNIKILAMLDDISFPNPGSSYTPLYYPVQSQSFGIGSLVSASWRAQAGFSMTASLGINASSSGRSVKGYSGSGSVVPDNFFARFGISGIKLADMNLGGTAFQSVRLGTSFAFTKSPAGTESTSFNTTINLSGKLWDKASISGSVTIVPFPPKFGGVTLSISMDPFRASFALDTLELKSMSFSCGTALNLGAMTGNFSTTASGLEKGMTGLSMRLSLSQGIFSAETSVSFAQRAEKFDFANLGSKLTFRFSPATVTVQATFGRYGLTRAAVTAGVVFLGGMEKMIDHSMRTALEGGSMAIGSRSRVVIATILALVIALMAGSFGVMAQCVTEMAITRTPDPLIIGQAVTITWTLKTQICTDVAFAGTLTRCVKSPSWVSGPCDVLTGGVEASGDTPFEVEYLFSPSEAGIYTVTGSYEGCTTCDPQLNPCSIGILVPYTFTVNQAGTTTSVVSDNNPSRTGENVRFTATVTSSWVGGPAIGGTVTFSANKFVTGWPIAVNVESDGTAIVQASFDANDSPITITATYDEASDANYATSSDSLSQVVLTGTTTVVTSNKNTIFTYPGTCENVMFTATVTPVAGSGTPTGTVDFYKGGTTLIGSDTLESAWPSDKVSIFTTFYAVESPVSITATYNGDADYAGSDGSLNPDQTVNPANTTTSISSDFPDPSVLGQPYLVTGTVIGSHGGCDPTTGTVTVTDNQGNGCDGDVDLNGDWSCSITSDPTTPIIPTDTYNLTAKYNGEDPNFAASGWSASELHTYADPGTRTEVMGADTPLIVKNTATYTVEVVDTSGSPVTTGTVQLSVSPSGKGNLSAASCNLDAAGQCKFTYTPTSGDTTPHAITARYLGEPEDCIPGDPVDPCTVHEPSTGTFSQRIWKRAADT